jgi:dUTP pyrophosphatase
MKVKFVKLVTNAIEPQKNNDSSGYDLYSAENIVILAGKFKTVRTGIAIEPEMFSNNHKVLLEKYVNFSVNWDIQIRSRSGLSSKNGIFVINGVGTIDIDYRGDIVVPLANFSDKDFTINVGDRIAQIVFGIRFDWIYFEEVKKLGETERGSGGFGSTGI